MVVPQQPAESLAALDLTGDAPDFLARIDRSVVEALVIALCVWMGEERNRSGLQRLLSEGDQAMQALILKGAREVPWTYRVVLAGTRDFTLDGSRCQPAPFCLSAIA